MATFSSVFFNNSSRSVFALARRLSLLRHPPADFFHSPFSSSSSLSPVSVARFSRPCFSPSYHCFFRYVSGGVSGDPPVADELKKKKAKESKEEVVVVADESLKVDDKDVLTQVSDDDVIMEALDLLAAEEERMSRNVAIVKFIEDMKIEVVVYDALPPGRSQVYLHSLAEYTDLMNILSKPPNISFNQFYEKQRKHDALMDSAILTTESSMSDILINLHDAQTIINSIADSKVLKTGEGTGKGEARDTEGNGKAVAGNT